MREVKKQKNMNGVQIDKKELWRNIMNYINEVDDVIYRVDAKDIEKIVRKSLDYLNERGFLTFTEQTKFL